MKKTNTKDYVGTNSFCFVNFVSLTKTGQQVGLSTPGIVFAVTLFGMHSIASNRGVVLVRTELPIVIAFFRVCHLLFGRQTHVDPPEKIKKIQVALPFLSLDKKCKNQYC